MEKSKQDQKEMDEDFLFSSELFGNKSYPNVLSEKESLEGFIPDIAFSEELKLKEFQHWILYLHPNQYYLGQVVLYLKRKIWVDFIEMTVLESRELLSASRQIKDVIKEKFSPDCFNYSSLSNSFRQCHLQIIPRYSMQREYQGETFKDENYGKNYIPYPDDFKIKEETLKVLKEDLVNGLDRIIKKKNSKSKEKESLNSSSSNILSPSRQQKDILGIHSNQSTILQINPIEEIVPTKKRRSKTLVLPTNSLLSSSSPSTNSIEFNEPKRPSSGFMLFANEHRESLKLQFPNAKVIEINLKLGRMWKELSEDQKQVTNKNKYILKSEEEKENYKKAMEGYRYLQINPLSSDEEESVE